MSEMVSVGVKVDVRTDEIVRNKKMLRMPLARRWMAQKERERERGVGGGERERERALRRTASSLAKPEITTPTLGHPHVPV